MLLPNDPLAALRALAPSPLIRGLHQKQREVLRPGGARFKGVLAPRRAGKSYLKASFLLGGEPNKVSLYGARTLKSCKAIMLPVFAELNAKYRLGLDVRQVEGEVVEPNGHRIRFHGFKDKAAADLLLGQKFDKAAVDEGGAFDSELLEYCVTKVIQPTLFDVRGPMLLGGTPGPIPKGFFYDVVGDPLGDGIKGRWHTFAWTLHDNPHLAGSAEENIAEILETNGWTEEHPTFRREVLGQWVNDAGALIYHYQGERWAPVPATGHTVLVVDFAGSEKPEADDTAFLVGRQPYEQRPHLFLVEGFKKHGVNLGQIAETIRQLQAKWGVNKVVVDAGALGAGYAKTLREVYNIDCEAADKRNKRTRIDLAVACLDTKTLHVCEAAAALVQEWLSLAWSEDRRDHHPRCADDLSDAMLYLLAEFSCVELPKEVIRLVTDVDLARERAMMRARRGAGLGSI